MAQQRHHADHAARQRAYRARQAQARAAEQQAKGLPPAAAIPTMPSRLRWRALCDQARLALETVRDELQAYSDDRSEAWQQSDRAAALQDHLEGLTQLLDDLDDLPPL